MYKQLLDLITGQVRADAIQRIADLATIPTDPKNRDYQDFLVWSQTNTINPADPLPDPTAILASQRTTADVELLSDSGSNAKLIRAIVLVMMDEINLIRSLLSPAQPARTVAQLKTAIQNKVNSGAAD